MGEGEWGRLLYHRADNENFNFNSNSDMPVFHTTFLLTLDIACLMQAGYLCLSGFHFRRMRTSEATKESHQLDPPYQLDPDNRDKNRRRGK